MLSFKGHTTPQIIPDNINIDSFHGIAAAHMAGRCRAAHIYQPDMFKPQDDAELESYEPSLTGVPIVRMCDSPAVSE